ITAQPSAESARRACCSRLQIRCAGTSGPPRPKCSTASAACCVAARDIARSSRPCWRPRIRRRPRRAPVSRSPRLARGPRWGGEGVDRMDAMGKVTGAERYGADIVPGDAEWLRVIRSPHSAAHFEFGDLAAFVDDHPGITGVVTAADVPYNRFAIFPDLRDQP